jgi:transcription-repair coupling factor (superfamily II helicase)
MDKDQLSDIWEEMIKGEIDVLVSTTIIETGVDVPNANTLIIERADKLGLSQLHQIRGRVGRSSRRAYAYFTYPAGRELREISEKRLSAIRDFTEFGSGFRIAMRDMEIRGVGNLLGAEQHGHMESIGYDLYMKLLSEAVLEEKGEVVEKKTECTVEMQVDAYIPEDYIPNANQRIDAYKKISLVETAEDLSDVYDELLDRYGEPPKPVCNILTISHIRALGARAGISKIVSKGSGVLFYPETPSAIKMTRLAAQYSGKVMVTLSGAPYFSLRTAGNSPSKTAKECVLLLEKYAQTEETL